MKINLSDELGTCVGETGRETNEEDHESRNDETESSGNEVTLHEEIE